MKALVKNIQNGTCIQDGELDEEFVDEMCDLIGKTIEVERVENAGCKNWYTDIDNGGWYWHKSWLNFFVEQERNLTSEEELREENSRLNFYIAELLDKIDDMYQFGEEVLTYLKSRQDR